MNKIIDTLDFKPIPWWKELYLRLRYPVVTTIDYGHHMKWVQKSITDNKGVIYILSYEMIPLMRLEQKDGMNEKEDR